MLPCARAGPASCTVQLFSAAFITNNRAVLKASLELFLHSSCIIVLVVGGRVVEHRRVIRQAQLVHRSEVLFSKIALRM